jgi:hypothetical protein
VNEAISLNNLYICVAIQAFRSLNEEKSGFASPSHQNFYSFVKLGAASDRLL